MLGFVFCFFNVTSLFKNKNWFKWLKTARQSYVETQSITWYLTLNEMPGIKLWPFEKQGLEYMTETVKQAAVAVKFFIEWL